MAAAKIVLDGGGVEKMLRSDEVRRMLHHYAERVESYARANAPRETGAYAASITTWDDETDRAAVRVGSDVPYAMVVESRTGNLSRALDAAGG